MAEEVTPKSLYLVDGTSNIFRAFYAIRSLTSPSGHPTNATFGFAQMLRKLLQEQNPEFVAVAFDRPEPTHRQRIYPPYKGNRQKPPEDLIAQIPDIRRVCEVLGIPVVEAPGFEADDLMGTLARKAAADRFTVVLVSSDKDLLQLVGDSVSVLNPVKGLVLDRQGVRDFFGVDPEQVVEVLALMGDASDNVPGVPGIGEKGAKELIRAYGSLAGCLEHRAEISRRTYRENLLQYQDQAKLSRELVQIHCDAPLAWEPDRFRRRAPSHEAAQSLFQELGFARLAEEFSGGEKPSPEESIGGAEETPLRRDIRSVEDLSALGQALGEAGRMILAPSFSAAEPMRARLQALGLSAGPNEIYVLEVRHETLADGSGMGEQDLLRVLTPVLTTPTIGKCAEDLKTLEVYLRRQGIRLQGHEMDTSLAGYLLDPGQRDYSLDRLAAAYLSSSGTMRVEPSEGRAKPATHEPAEEMGRRCRILRALPDRLDQELRIRGLDRLYRETEAPLLSILAEMEFHGVRVDVPFLESLCRQWTLDLERIQKRLYEMVGEEFNIQSPPQLRRVLFEKLGLKPGRKTDKEKDFSTGMDVLETLAGMHPVPAMILEHRGLSKLLSTYVTALPGLVHPETGRVHASFNQTTAATGRLSSSNPNLQNIPIRTERGRQIRKAFLPQEKWRFVVADYSQIELRILAHLSQDPEMMRAFRTGEDIHARTATAVFGVPESEVTEEMRRQAKLINFGILYGMGPFRLSRELGVTQVVAQRFIEEYFQRFAGVKDYFQRVLSAATRDGHVSTLFGRIRSVPELRSQNENVRRQGGRVAINTTVQGTAADLIKRAMVILTQGLNRGSLRAHLLIQVHDELVLEVPEEEIGEVMQRVRDSMEQCAKLDVPLVAEVKEGPNWLDLKKPAAGGPVGRSGIDSTGEESRL